MMIVDYIALLPEISLAFGALLMFFVHLFSKTQTPKTFYTINRIFMLIAAFCTIIFYNQSVGTYFINNNYTTLFKLIIYILSFLWGYLSLKRFQSKNRSSFGFYILFNLNIICFSLAIATQNMLILFGSLSTVLLLNYGLMSLESVENKNKLLNLYLLFSGFFIIAFGIGVVLIYNAFDTTQYEAIKACLEIADLINWQVKLAFVLIICSLLFMMGIAPFHFWFADMTGFSILPVSGYLSIIPIFAYFSCFVSVVVKAFYPLYLWFSPVMVAFGCLSIAIGAIGANSKRNLRKIFAYAGLYYLGGVIISLSHIDKQSLLSSFVYLLVYTLAIFGIYTVFYGCRSRGEYLSSLGDIRGISTQRPFLATAMLIFMISMIGTPPLLGFLGKLAIINNLVASQSYVLISVILFSILVLAYAYLKIITTIYFDHRDNNFDKPDRGVYICLAINIALVLITILNPKYLMNDVEAMLIAIW